VAGRQTSPGNAHPPSRLCPPHIRPRLPCKYGALKILGFSPGAHASYAIPVRRASALPAASFGSRLAANTLAVRLTVPLAGSAEDSHLQMGAPCRAQHRKGAETPAGVSAPFLCQDAALTSRASFTSCDDTTRRPGRRGPARGATTCRAPVPPSMRRAPGRHCACPTRRGWSTGCLPAPRRDGAGSGRT